MKYFLTIVISIFLVACSKDTHIPETSILEEIPTDELSKILEYEINHPNQEFSFEEYYPSIREIVDTLPEIKKAKYYKLTYRELMNAEIESNDSTLLDNLEKVYDEKYRELLLKAKAQSKDFYTKIALEVKTEAKRCSIANREFYIHTYLYRKDYSDFFGDSIETPLDLWDEAKRDYIPFIRENIDKSFTYKSLWIRRKALESLQEKYPLGSLFLLDELQDLENILNQ